MRWLRAFREPQCPQPPAHPLPEGIEALEMLEGNI